MAISRRTLLELSLTGAAGLAAGRGLAVAAPDGTETLAADFEVYFDTLGYRPLPPLDMITGESFNGGLRYDDTRLDNPANATLCLQPSARIGDIAERGKPGVLALFTICALRQPEPAAPGMLFGQILDFLVSGRKLDPERMVFVSTEVFEPYGEQYGTVRAGQFLKRSTDEAMAAGDGSGYFGPRDHPARPGFATVSIHYPLAGAVGSGLSYPPEGYQEIAEIGISPLEGAGGAEVGGFGLERVVLAEGGAIPDFEQSRLALLQLVEDEAQSSGKDLPPGYDSFTAL